MAQYLIQDTTLTNIADAIREKASIENTLYPEQMPAYIRSIQTTTSDTSDIDSAVVGEADRVVDGMLPKMAANSLNFIAMSDMHEIGDGENSYDYVTARIRNGNLHAGQAAKLISDRIPLDFYANLGDFIYGSSATTGAQGLQCFVKAKEYIHDVVKANESFLTVGNHDAMLYSTSTTGVSIPYSILSDIIGTYRYKDYEDKKVRVICLNTADNSVTSTYKEWVSGAQLQWFANMLDLSAKSDASEWGIIILSHHPLDWGEVKVAANCLATYLEGGTYSVTHGGVSVSKDFSGKNQAKIIAQFHGHVHGFKVDYINDLRSGSPVPTTVKRVAIPNACFERTNEYGENSKLDSNNIEFGETSSYEKVENDFSQDTAFCLVSIDLDNEVIYADCYGAGYDRVISYAVEEIISYSITNTLSNATNSNSTSTIVEGEVYTATISANTGYSVSSIKVTMGGTDITSTAVSGNNISIASVTGDVVITVSTTVNTYSVTNTLTKVTTNNSASTATYGSSYTATLTAASGYTMETVKVTMGGTDVTSSAYSSVTGKISIASVTGAIVITATATETPPVVYTVTINTDDNVYVTGESTATAGSSYSATFQTTGSYYPVSSATVTMGGTDITSSALSYEDDAKIVGSIGIANVTGDIVITMAAEYVAPPSYTNLVPTSIDPSTGGVYNTVGYKDGKYASGNNEGTDSACVLTGLIAYGEGVTTPIYIKGADITTASHCRILGFNSAKQASIQSAQGASLTTYFTVETLGTSYYKVTPTSSWTSAAGYSDYLRFSLIGEGENLIITLNQPIE